MRRKCTNGSLMAIDGGVEVTLAGACLFLATLVWLLFVGQQAQEHPRKMVSCSEGGSCLSELAYVPGERVSVAIAKLEVR